MKNRKVESPVRSWYLGCVSAWKTRIYI